MRKSLILLLACIMASCSDPNESYVKKAVRIMDKNGIYAQGLEWEKAKEEALSAQPSSLEEAQEIVLKAGKVAGGKHTYLMTADEVNDNDTSVWEMPTVNLKFSSRKRSMSVNTAFVMKSVGIAEQKPIDCPVALLTDEWTGSSGEAVLICFRGLANARTFGMHTAGYCSCNQIYALPGGSQLVLTIGEDIARTGEAFCDDPIEPDVTTEMPFEEALEWINSFQP